jgi:hypothetical protein
MFGPAFAVSWASAPTPLLLYAPSRPTCFSIIHIRRSPTLRLSSLFVGTLVGKTARDKPVLAGHSSGMGDWSGHASPVPSHGRTDRYRTMPFSGSVGSPLYLASRLLDCDPELLKPRTGCSVQYKSNKVPVSAGRPRRLGALPFRFDTASARRWPRV